jgi:Domain of unknown function (DUF3854)
MSTSNGQLLPRHRAELCEGSALTPETVEDNHVHSESDPAAVARLLNCSSRFASRLGSALVYPYFDRDGNALDHATVKPDSPRPRKDKPGKVKYENPHKKPNRTYIPAGARAAVAHPTADLLITEGCKKALAATQAGFPCLSIPGVWGWCLPRPKKNGKGFGPFKLNADLAGIEWKGRRVYLVFDSDLATNPNVALAEWKFAEALRALGADVRAVRLPPEADGQKNGLDDFLVRRGAEALKLLVETARHPTEPPSKEPKKKAPSAADVLAGIGLETDLWHDATQTAYATVGRHSHPVKSKPFRQWLVNEYRRLSCGKIPNAEAVGNALAAIEAAAVFDGPERPAFVRVAGHAGRVYLHLADVDGSVIEIDAKGWRACDKPPVRFRKTSGMLPLPMPQHGGSFDDLRDFLNVADDDAFALVKAFATATFRPDDPFPVLVLMGEQGSCKTTTARVLKKLIDPSAAPDRGTPRDERDLMIRARGNWLLPYDNLSSLPEWLSDAFCRLATGGGFGTRELYSDDGEVIFDAKRPLILNGIAEFVERADLLERSLLIRHPPVPDKDRRPESEFWASFDAAHPKLLGALLDRVSAGMRELPGVNLDGCPRMADFALFAVACETGAGEQARFQAAYAENQAGAREQALDVSSVPAVLVAMMENLPDWTGTASALLKALTDRLPTTSNGTPKFPQDWPKTAAKLSGVLARLAPNLRRVNNLVMEAGRQPGGNRARFVRITKLPRRESNAETASPASPASRDDAEPVDCERETPSPGSDGPSVPVASHRAGSVPGSVPPETPENKAKTQPRDDRDDRDATSHSLSGPDDAKPQRKRRKVRVNDDREHDLRNTE